MRKWDCFWLPAPTWASTAAGAISLKVISLSHFLTFENYFLELSCFKGPIFLLVGKTLQIHRKDVKRIGWIPLNFATMPKILHYLITSKLLFCNVRFSASFRRLEESTHYLCSCCLINVGFYYNQFMNFNVVLMSFRQVEKSSKNKQHDGSKY